MYLYMFVFPMIKSLIYGPPEVFYGPTTLEEWEKIDPNNFYNTWTYTILKYCIYACFMFICLLLMIWTQQEKILYVPAQPIQFIE